MIISSDGTGKKYTITLSENQSFAYFQDEFPSESDYTMEEFTVTDKEWEMLVQVIQENEFTDLPEVLPKGDLVYDGSEYAIRVETEDESYLVQGGAEGSSFECIPVRFLFWDGDDEFPAQGNLLFDASATDYIHVESIVTIATLGLTQLAKTVGIEVDRSTFPVF